MLVVINAEDYFLSNKNFFEDKELVEIENAIINNPEMLDVAFVVKLPRNEGKKFDSRRKLYKILSKTNAKEFPVFKTYNVKELSIWIKNCAKSKDIAINEDAIHLLIEQIGNNLREFDVELEKLRLIAYPNKTVTKQMVADVSITNQDLFNFTDFIMKNQKDKALLEFKKLLDKKHPLEILAATQTMLKKWIILKLNSGESSQTLAKVSGMTEFLATKTLEKLRNTKLADLVAIKNNLFEVEYKIKSAEAIDIISEVECAIIR